jgi:tRNA threonylcarbamoyladenosine biosynthesis protein TsaB
MILAIKTDSETAELYLLNQAGEQVDKENWQAGRELSNQLLAKIQELLKRNKLGFDDVSGVLVFKGPGSFTSLRIGISVANALAYGLDVPIACADGKDWLSQGTKLSAAIKGEYAVPEYGAEPNITKPRK